MESLSWFKNSDCVEMTIIKYKSISDESGATMLTIKDKEAVQSLVKRIQSLPVQGDEMISPAPTAPRTLLSFRCANGTFESIEFINQKIKTPSTGFLSANSQKEENLYRDIDGWVAPALNKRIAKLKDQPIAFKDFYIKYAGEVHTPQPPDGPTVGPTSRALFDVWEKGSANLTKLEIFSGQIPPQPKAFVVGDGKIYYLLTYQGFAQERLYPGHFEVSEKLPTR